MHTPMLLQPLLQPLLLPLLQPSELREPSPLLTDTLPLDGESTPVMIRTRVV
jgi:hypothetical protein